MQLKSLRDKKLLQTLLSTFLLSSSLAFATTDDPGTQTGACCFEDPDVGQMVCQVFTEHVCIDYNGNYYGDGTTCNGILCTSVDEGACCYEDPDLGQLVCQIVTADTCTNLGGYYYGDGSICSDPTIECHTVEEDGACCVPNDDGTYFCYILSALDCDIQGGYYYGDGTNCSDPFVECDTPPTDGACCVPNADGTYFCYILSAIDCHAQSGYYYGDGSNCSDPFVECDTPPTDGACCVPDALGNVYCFILSHTDCLFQGGWYYGDGTNCSDPFVECDVEPNGCEINERSNCAGRPQYIDPDFANVFGDGRVAIETTSPSILGGQVVKVFDLSNINSAPNNNWFAVNRYSDPDWSPQNLGSIFGLTVDGDGNIFVTATKSWNQDVLASGGWGAVYRLDHITGDITLFASLPNQGSSLGNITWDCDRRQFFVSNIEDGLIYRLDASGNILDTFDHGTPWNGTAGPAALGDRVWAVEVHGGRLYYSVWNEDRHNKSSLVANEIWSVALNGAGQPTAGLEQLEVAMPEYTKGGDPEMYSSPVSDIRFSEEGSMLVAERSMNGWNGIHAHDARALEFECENGVWLCDVNRFQVGDTMFNPRHNASGGIDSTSDLLFASGDALHLSNPDNIYGFQAFPIAGGDVTNSKLVDYQDNLSAQDKTLIGDLVVTGANMCLPVMEHHVNCVSSVGGGMHHEFGFSFSHTGIDTISGVQVTAPAGLTATPSYFNGPYAPMYSYLFNTNVYGATAGGVYCFEITLFYGHDEESCTIEICVEFPECIDPCPGDLNGNMIIDIGDLLAVLALWGQTCSGCPADLDNSGVIDIGDLLAIIALWGTPCG